MTDEATTSIVAIIDAAEDVQGPLGPAVDQTACNPNAPNVTTAPTPSPTTAYWRDLFGRAQADPGAAFAPDVVASLVDLSQADYESCRAQLKRVGVRVGEVDRAVKEYRAARQQAQEACDAGKHQGAALALYAAREEEVLLGAPVDLNTLLNDISAWLHRFVVLTHDQSRTVTLWVAHTHAFEAADCTPYLQITSATKRAGKTRLLEVVEPLVARPWFTGRTTAAALVRRIDRDHPTLLLDESDAAFGGEKEYAEALRGILNSGYRRSGRATVCVGRSTDITAQDFQTFSPKAIAGIGKLPDTVADRSVPIALRRRRDSEPCERWRERSGRGQAAPLRGRLVEWARGALATLQEARPDLPVLIGDRLSDVWEPLIAIADVAGGDWPERARRAAVALAGAREDGDPAIDLLTDIADILDTYDGAFIATATLIEKLVAREERPWALWRRGDKPITAKGVAGLLGPLDIHPTPGPNGQSRGYRVDAFDDARARYLAVYVSTRQTTNNDGPESTISMRQDEMTVDASETVATPIGTGLFDALTLGTRRNQQWLPTTLELAARRDDAEREAAEERAAIQAEACKGSHQP